VSELTYMIIPAHPHTPTRIGRCTFANAYELMRGTVGGYIELVSLKLADMYVNEEGKLQDCMANPRATQLAWVDGAISYEDYIAGDVVIFGKANEVGDETSITSEFRSHTLRVLGGKA
jgi:hypothetical protein